MITTRRAVSADLEPMLQVEKAAISLGYLKEVHADFFADNEGEMTLAVEGDTILGFGKLTIQYDGSAWAELLRVHPDYQGKGAGNAIWARYMEQCQEKNVPYIRMYTGVSNVVSKHLAEKNGLNAAHEYSEAKYPIAGNESCPPGFIPIDFEMAQHLLPKISGAWGDYSCFNRTFYSLGLPYLKGLAQEEKLYSDGESVMALGSRFMPERGIHIGFMAGNPAHCIAFAKAEGAKRHAPCVITMHRAEDSALHDTLLSAGFAYLPANLYLLEGRLR